MKPCHKFYSKSSTLASTSHSNKSTSDHNKAESSKYYELNIGYSEEKECIQLHFTPQEAYKDDKENSLSAGETFSNNFAINFLSETNKPQRNASALLTLISSNDEKIEKKRKEPININLTSTSLSVSSIKLIKTGENKDLAIKRKMTLENDLADSSKDDNVLKHLKGRFKEASTDPKDIVIGVANKKVKSKKIQTSKNIIAIEDVSAASKKKKNKGTYVEQQEIYSASNPNESLSTALIPSLRVKSSVSTKSSIIRKRKHRRKKHHRHHRHRSGEREGKAVHNGSSATLKSHVLQEILPIQNKPKGLGFFFLKNKLVWPVHTKNYAGDDSHKDETITCITEEINKCKTKIKNKVDNYKDLLEVQKPKRPRRGSTETLKCETKCKTPDNVDTVIIKKPDELNSSSELNVMVKKKHKRIKECSSNSANDTLKAAVETKLKKKHNKLRRDSRNELRKVVSSKIKHKDSKYKKIDAASNVKIRSSDGLTGSQKHKRSKTELESSHHKNETDSKREKKGSASNRHKKRSKSKYNESEILDSKAQYWDNTEENAGLVVESIEVGNTRRKKHRKEKALIDDLILGRDKPTKKMKNKKVDTHSLVNIKQKHSKHKRRKSSLESKRSKHSSKNDKNNSDTAKREKHKSSSKDTKKSDEKKYTHIYEKYEDIFDENWDDRKSIKISRNQLREFLQEITGNLDINESKTEQTDTSHNNKAKTNSLRKEVSFSHLNLNPVAALYTVPALNIKAIEPKSSASPSTKEKKQVKSKKKGKELDEQSVVSEAVTKKEKTLYVSGKRFQSKSSSRSGVCLKNIEKVRKEMQQNDSFSVKGMQPREESKPTPVSSIHVAKKVVQRHRQKLEKVVLSVVEIKPAKFFARGLESNKVNKTASHNHRGASNIQLSKKRINREATVEGNSSEAASKSSASGITTIQAIYLADDNLETKSSDENSRAAIMEKVTQPDVETPLIQQVVLSKGLSKQRVVQNKSSRSVNADQELLTNSNKVLKRSGRYQKDSSLERAQMQTKKPTKRDCQKFLQTSPVSSREPSTDEVPRTKANKNKYSSTRLKSCSISSIKCPKSHKSKTPRHTSPLNNGNSDLKLNRIYYKPISEVSPSLSSGLSVTSIERYQMRRSNVFKSISNKKASLPRSRQRSGQIVNPRIKEYAKQCERRQRLSRDSSISSKSSVGRDNSRELHQGRTNKMYSHLIDSEGFLQQIHPKNQIKTNRSLNKNPYIVSDPHVESDSFQAVKGGQFKTKKHGGNSIPSATSKLHGNQQVNKNSKDVAVNSHSSERQWHNLLADAEGYLSRVQSNLQDILSGDLTALTKITEETSQESMRFSNLSHSSRHTRRESSFNCKKASNIGNASDKQALFIAQGNNFSEVNRKYQVACESNQERKMKNKPTGNLQAEDRLSGQTKHRKRNKSDTNYGKPDKIFSPYCVEKGKILQIFNIDTMEEPTTSTETKNHKSRENSIQNLQGAKRSSFNDVIVSPCIANNELEDTPVKDIKSSSEERDSGDTEAASSNDSGSRELPVITISTHLDKATNQEQQNTQNAFIKKDKSSNNISNNQDLINGINECNGFEDTDNRYPLTNSALLLAEVTVDNVENQEEELKESKIRLANSFKKSIMEELQTANFLQQNDDIVQLIVDNSNEEELVQLNEIISQNVSNLVKQKVRSMLRFEEVPEPADGNVLKRESSPTMCPKLNIQTEANKMKHYDTTTDVKTRENTENTDNFNSGTHKKCHQQSIDTTKRENKNDAFVLISKSSQESNSAVSKPKANAVLVSPIVDDYFSKKPPTVKVVSKNSTHIQLSQVTHRPLTNTTCVDSASSRDSSNRIASNIYNTQRSSEANLEFIQHSASSDYNDYWEAKDKKPRQTSKIPRSKNTAIHALEETPTLQAKPRTAPSSKEQQSKASLELFQTSMQLKKFWAEKQENKTNAGSSCSTMANSFRNKPSTCLFTKNDRKDNRMSTFEKRKQYGELLRRKQTRARNQDCIYCCPQVFHFDETGKIQSEKRVLPSRPTTPNLAGKYSEPSTPRQLAAVKVLSPKDRYGYEPHGTLGHHASRIDYCNLCCSVCNKLCCCCKKRQISDEDSSAFAASHPSLPTIIRPVPLDEQNMEKSADVNQTLTATVDQENAIKTKFKSKSDVSLFSKESGFSCGSFPHPNSTVSAFSIGHKSVCNSKSNVLYTTGSDKVFCSVGEPKRSLPYKSMVRALQLRERSASGSAVYNVKDSSTSKTLLQTMEQNNLASDCPNNVERKPSVILTSTHVKLVKARQSDNTAQFIECQRKKSAESHCVSSKSTVGKGYRHNLKETKSLSYQNLRRYSQHISQLSDDLKKLNNLSEMPRVASISRNKFKKLVQYVEEHRKVKNDNTKQSKINDKKTQQKPATCLTRNNTARATCNSKQSKETKNVNSNRSFTKTNFQKKTYNNETINEQNKAVEQSSSSSCSNHNKNISYKRNNVQTKFFKNSALENKCNDASFTIFNSNKEIALKRKDTRILIKSDSEECFKIFAYNSIVKLEDTYSLTLPTYINGLNTNDFFRGKNIKKSKFLCRDEYLYRNQRFLKNPSSTSCPEITKNYEKKKLLNTLFDQQDNFMHAFAHGDEEPYNSKNFPLKPFPAIITLPVCVKVMGWAENTELSKLPKKLLPRSPNSAKLNHAVPKDDPVAHTSKRFNFDKSNRSQKVARKNPLDTKSEQSKLPHRLDYRSIARKLLHLGHQEFKSTQVSEAVWHSDCKESRFPRKRTYTQLHKLPRGRRSVGSATSSSTMPELLSERNQSNYVSRLKQNTDESSPSADWSHKQRKDQGTQCYNYIEDEAIKSNLLKTDYRTTSCSTISLHDLLSKEIPSHNSLPNNHLDGEARLSKTRASLFLIFKKELLQALLSSNSFELTEDDLGELSVKAFGQTNYLPPTTKNSIELSGKGTYTLLSVENPIEISKKSTYTILPGRETYDEATYTPWPAKALREMSEKATYTLSQDSIETFEKATLTKETSEKATYTVSPVKRLGKIYEEATSTLLPEKSTETFEKSTYTLPLDIESVDRGTYTMLPSAVVSTEIFVRTTCTLSGDTLHSMSDYSDSMQFLDNSHKEIVAETAKQLMPGSFGNKPFLHEPKGKMYESATTVVNSLSIRDLVKGLFSKPSDELLDMELPTSYTNVIAKSEDENIETIREESTALSSDSKQSLYDEVPQKIKKNLPIKTLNITPESIIEEFMHTLEAKLSEVIDIKCKKLLDEAKHYNSSVKKQDDKSSKSHSKLCCQQAYLFNKLLALDEEPLFIKTRLEELHDIFLNNVDKPLQSHKSNQAIHKELPMLDMPNKSFEQLIEFKLKRAWLDKSRKLINLLQESDLTASQTQITTPSKKKVFISKSIKSFQNLFKRPGKKPTTESICKQTQCPSTCVLKEVAHAASQKSTESLFEEDEEVLYKTKLYTTESTLRILKKFLSKTKKFKERSKAKLRETSTCADTPLMISEKHSAQVMVERPPKHLLNPSLKTFLTASLKDLPYLPNEDASVKMFENVPSTPILKQKSAQTLLEELQEKFSNKFFSAVNNPLVYFEEEDLQKDNHHKCNARRNCRNWRLCKAEEVSDDLLKKMSQMPLTAIVKLHEQQFNDQNPQMSFKTLVEDLYKDIQEDKLKITKSQECIVHVLKKSMKKDGVEDEAAQKSEQSQTVAEKSTDKENTVATDSIRASISEGFISVTNALKYEESSASKREANRAESSSTLTPFWKESLKLSPKGSKNKQETIERNVALTSDNGVDQNFNKTSVQRKIDSLMSIGKGNKKGYIKQNLLPTKEKDEDERSTSDENMLLLTGHEENARLILVKGKTDHSKSNSEVNKMWKSLPSKSATKNESNKSTSSKEKMESWSSYEKLSQKFNENVERILDYEENVSIASSKGKASNLDSTKSTKKESKKSSFDKEKKDSLLSHSELIKKMDGNLRSIRDHEENETVSTTSSAKGRGSNSDSGGEVNVQQSSPPLRRLTKRESRKSTLDIEKLGWPFNDESIQKNVSRTSAKGKSDSMDEVNKKPKLSSHRKSTRKESNESTSGKQKLGSWISYDEPIKKIDENRNARRDFEKNENVSITSAKGRSDSSDSIMDEVNKKRISSHRRLNRKGSRKSTNNWLFYDDPNKKIDENTKATRDYKKNKNVSIPSMKGRSDSSDSMDEVNKKQISSSHRRSTRKESKISTLSKEKMGWPFNDESIKKMDENGRVAKDYEKNENVSITSAKGGSDSSYSMVEVNKKPKLSSHRRSTGKESKLSTPGKEKTDSWPSYNGSKQKLNVNVALTPENDIVKPDNSDSNSEGNIKQKSLSSKRAATKEYTKSNSKRWSSYDKLNQKVGRSVGSENDLPSVARYSDSFVSEGEIDKRGSTKQKSMRKANLEKPISSKTISVSSPSFSSATSIEQIKEKVYKKKRELDNKINKKHSKHASLEEDSGSATLDDEKTVPNAEANSKTQSQKKSPHLKKGARSLEADENFGTILKEKQGFSTLVSCACAEKRSNALEQLREALTDKELFEKLLNSYEREERIVERLSNDEEFIKSQLELIRKKRAGVRDTNAEETLPTTSALAKIQEEDEERELRTIKKVSEERVEKKRDAVTAVPEGKEASTSTHSVVGKGASQSTVSVTKSSSKTKSGFKSRVTRMFGIGTNDNEQMKEIVAPREEKRDSIDQKVAEAANEDNQKVKFRKGGDPFEEEKKMLNFSNTSLLRPHFAKSERRSSQDSNDSNIIKPSDLGKSFLRGFRTDHVALDGDTCLFITKAERERRLRPNLYKEAMIEFSERDSPLEYLLALGFSIDEASNAIKDEDVKNRLFAAITEARIWVNQISTVQGTLLYLVSYKTKPKTMRYFLQLVEAIINKRINNAVKLNSFLRVLEKVEDGDLTMIHILGSDKFDDEENEEKVIKKQLRQLFIDVYKIAEYEATLKGITVSKEGTVLLRIMAAKYRAGLHPHLELIARYIGQGLIKTEVQLEAAMIYLSRLDTADVNLKEFEQYVAIRCKQDQKPGAKK